MKLLDQVRDVMRRNHYSIRTEQAYCSWIKQYILFHKNVIQKICEVSVTPHSSLAVLVV